MRISLLKTEIIHSDDLVEKIIKEVAAGKRVVVKGLGSFYPVLWETRIVKLSGQNRMVTGRNIVMFRASKRFKEEVRGGRNGVLL